MWHCKGMLMRMCKTELYWNCRNAGLDITHDLWDLDRSSKCLPNVKPSIMGVYEVDRIVAKLIQRQNRVLHWVEELLPSREHMGARWTLERGAHLRLWGQSCWPTSRGWMQRETCASVRKGFKDSPSLQQNDHHEARRTSSDLSWFVDRSPRDSVPCQWRGVDKCRIWALLEKVFNGGCRIDIQVASGQITFLSQRSRFRITFPSSGKSSDQVHEEPFYRKHAVNCKRLL